MYPIPVTSFTIKTQIVQCSVLPMSSLTKNSTFISCIAQPEMKKYLHMLLKSGKYLMKTVISAKDIS